MKMFLISDNDDTLTGMRLAGAVGVLAHTKEEVLAAIADVHKDPEIAVLVITEKISTLAKDEIDKIKLNEKVPLVVVIPDRHGTKRPKDFITQYVKEAVGIKV